MTLAQVRRWSYVGVLTALALVLSYIETFIPLPVPVAGIKLGLANIVVLVALVLLDARSALAVALVKVLAAGFLFGSPLTMAYSAAGTVLAYAGMALLAQVRGLHVALVAIVGAILHNMGQLLVAMLILGTPLVWFNAPVLAIAACITGILTGMAAAYALRCLEGAGVQCACRVTRRGGHGFAPTEGSVGAATFQAQVLASIGGSVAANAPQAQCSPYQGELSPEWATEGVTASADCFAGLTLSGPAAEAAAGPAPPERGSTKTPATSAPPGRGSAKTPATSTSPGQGSAEAPASPDPVVALVALVVGVAAVLHASGSVALGASCGIALAVAIVSRFRMRDVVRTVRPLVAILLITAVMQIACNQMGTVVVQFGGVYLTFEALEAIASMMLRLLCIMVLSVAFMRSVDVRQLTQTLQLMLRPLMRIGIDCRGFLFSLDVAFRFIPVLNTEFKQLRAAMETRGASFKQNDVRARLKAYQRLFAPLLVSAFRRADSLAEASVSRCFGM